MTAITPSDRPDVGPETSKRQVRHGLWSMLPSQRGAYAALVFPLLTVLFVGRSTREAWLLVVAASFFFLAHEPMMISLGLRGPREERDRRGTARGLLAVCAVASVAFGLSGLWLASRDVQSAALAPLVFAILALMWSGEGLGRTPVGEALVVIALTLLALPVGLACGLSPGVSTGIAGFWALVGVLGASAARLRVGRNRFVAGSDLASPRPGQVTVLIVSLATIGAALIAPFADVVYLWIFAAAWPTAVAAVGILLARPRRRGASWIGWTLLAANVFTWVALVMILLLMRAAGAVWQALMLS